MTWLNIIVVTSKLLVFSINDAATKSFPGGDWGQCGLSVTLSGSQSKRYYRRAAPVSALAQGLDIIPGMMSFVAPENDIASCLWH